MFEFDENEEMIVITKDSFAETAAEVTHHILAANPPKDFKTFSFVLDLLATLSAGIMYELFDRDEDMERD